MMYCPKCGTENTDTASYCRGCGANIALVPQALTGTLADANAAGGEGLTRRERRDLRHGRKDPNIESAVVPFFGGLGFFLVAFAVMAFMPGGRLWGFWLFIPAFFMMGGGLAAYLRWKETQKTPQFPTYAPPSAIPPAPARASDLPPRRDTSDLYKPGSVTEGTTRLLDREQ